MVHAPRHRPEAAGRDPGERHARRRLDRAAGTAAGGRPEDEPPRPRHVRPAVPRPGEQGLLPEPPREAPAEPSGGRGAHAARGRALRADPRPRPRQLPPRGPARPPQGRPHARAGPRALAGDRHVPRPRRQLRQGLPHRDGRRRPRVPEDDGGPARLRRHAGRGPRVGHDVLAGDAGEVRLRLHRRDDLDEPRRQAHAPVDARRGRDRPRRAGLHGPARLEDRRHPRDGADRHLRQPDLPAGGHRPEVRRALDGGADEPRDRRRGEERRRHRDQRPLQAAERGLPAPRQGEGREVHLRHEQRRGERPRRLVVPARDAEEARPEVAGHVRPRPPAEPRPSGSSRRARRVSPRRAAARRGRDGAGGGRTARSITCRRTSRS